MASERRVYVERTPWPAWVRGVFWGANVMGFLALLGGWDTALPAAVRLLVASAVVGAAVGLHALVDGLTVRVRETGILLHFGRVPLLRRWVPFAEIVSATSIRYGPILEFGGWGIRGTRRRRAWTARGDQAVKLELTGGRRLLIGSDRPERLEDRIRSALADWQKMRGPGAPPGS